MFVAIEPTLKQVISVSIECADCGRMRWRKPRDLYVNGIGPTTALSELGARLTCSSCKDEGMPGKNVVIQAAFAHEIDRIRAEAGRIRSLEVREAG